MTDLCKKRVWSNGGMEDCGKPAHGFCDGKHMCEFHFDEYKKFIIDEWRLSKDRQKEIENELRTMHATIPKLECSEEKNIVYLIEEGKPNFVAKNVISSYDNAIKKVEDLINEFKKKTGRQVTKIKTKHKDANITDRWSYFYYKLRIRKIKIEDIV